MAQAGKGRPKGRLNKTTVLAKQAIAEAFDKLGGTEGLVSWAEESDENKRVFYATIWPKIIPVQTEISGPDGEAIRYEQVNEDAHAFRRRLLSSVATGSAGSGASETVQ
jgi:hypothetical protein